MINAICKVMYWVVNAYSLLVGTAMTWNELIVDKYPKTAGFVTGVVIGSIILK